MAKITTIIDIGSNSMRMVVFKKTSRFGFHLINESKAKVKISEGCYENNGNLQELPMDRAFDTLKSFLSIASNLKSRKIICVATSALRDAPNKKQFISKVSKELKLNIKVIDGTKEAYYGGVATLNLLPNKNFMTIDIGGGSTEFAIIEDSKIQTTVSLNIGTVRFKELYFNKNDLVGAKKYILEQISSNFGNLKQNFSQVVGLGGSARALSRIILKKSHYSLDTLHGFEYDVDNYFELFEQIINAKDNKELKALGVEKDRYDTIIVGTFIWQIILEYFNVQRVITSGVGVREGVYLCDILRTSNHTFPANFNISVKSLLDRFIDDESQSAYLGNNAKKIFDSLSTLHNLSESYRSILVVASKIQLVGISLNFEKNEDHAFWYILNGLNYGFTHQDKILIAIVTKYTKKSLPKQEDIEEFTQLLPSLEVVQWLNFMMTLNMALNSEFSKTKYDYTVDEKDDKTVYIKAKHSQYLVKRALKKIEAPIDLELKLI